MLFLLFRVSVRMLIFRLVIFLFLFLGFALDLSQGIPIMRVKVFVVEVAFLAILTDLVEIVHVELIQNRYTCRTKDE